MKKRQGDSGCKSVIEKLCNDYPGEHPKIVELPRYVTENNTSIPMFIIDDDAVFIIKLYRMEDRLAEIEIV